MKTKIFMCLLALVSVSGMSAQDFNQYEKKLWISKVDTLPYRMLLPVGFDSTKRYPLILFLHGAGERGNDNEKQLTHGAKLFLTDSIQTRYPAIVVFPQCAENSYWSNVKRTEDSITKKTTYEFTPDGDATVAIKLLMQLMKNLVEKPYVKKQQVYVMGLSMGGMGTFEIVRRMPQTFAAAIPICGGAHPATAKEIRHTAFWVFHGAKDDVVSYTFSEAMVSALQEHYDSAEVQFTLYSNANHNSWDKAFAEPEMMSWLFSHSKKK